MENEIQLLNAAKARNEDAFAKIFDLYAPALYRYAWRLGCDSVTADHVVGEAFAKFLDQIWLRKEATINLRSSLYQIAHNLIIEHKRSAGKNAPPEAADTLRDDAYSASPGLSNSVMPAVLRVIQNDLTEDQRHVIILRFLEEFSLKETAAILGKKVSHIKVIQIRGLAKLGKILGHAGTGTST